MKQQVVKRTTGIIVIIIGIVIITTIGMVLRSENSVKMKLHIFGSGVDIETTK